MNKNIWVLIAGIIICLSCIVIVNVGDFDENKEQEKEILGPKTKGRIMYEEIVTMLEEAPTPTLHDANGDPFERVFASASGDGRFNYIQYDIYDKKTKQGYLYFVYDFSDEYDFAKKHGQPKALVNGQKVYVYEGQYTWRDEKTGYYYHIVSLNEETTSAAVLEDVILSLDTSIHHVLDKPDGHILEDKIALPTHAAPNNTIQEMSFEYVKSGEKEVENPSSIWSLTYDTYQLKQSVSYDFTFEFQDQTNIRKEGVKKSIAYIDEGTKRVAYTDDEYDSVLLSPYEGVIVPEELTNEFLKVIESFE